MTKKLKLGKRKEEGIKLIKNMVNDMFIQLETMSELSKILLESEDKELALQIIDEDKNMDDMMSDITIEISNFITREQPFAQDLRIAISSLGIITDLERMADYYKNFARFILKGEVNSTTQNELLNLILDELLIRINKLQIIYDEFDHQAAKELAKKDIEIDNITKELTKNINEKLIKAVEFDEVKNLTRILLITKVFERAGDHLVNVCEHISYINKGQIYHYS
ncbi:MAG: phosphate signaling complex PhoU family protein [Mycoplasmatales bacterium]